MAGDALPDSVPASPSSESQASPSTVPSIIASSDALPEYSGEDPNGETVPSTESGAEGFNFAGTAPSVVSAPPYPGALLVSAPIPTGDHFIIAHPITPDAIHPAVLNPTPRNLTRLLYPEDLEDTDQVHRPLLPLFNSLPPEMVLHMMSYLQPLHLINFLFAEYDLLCQFMVVDKFTARYFGTLLSPCTVRPRLRPLVGIERIPTELLLQIMVLLNAADLANLVFASYQLMEARGLAPSLSRGMASQFWIAEHRKLTIDAAYFTLVDGVVIRKPSVNT